MFLGDRDEPYIIDDTPQFFESTRININSRSRAPGIRANSAQTTLLKKAYEESNVLSSKQAKNLSEETGLPPKWILQWFSRQRSKERKNGVTYEPMSKPSILGSVPTTGHKQASNSAAFSAAFFSDSGSCAPATGNIPAQEFMTIKSEYQDLSLTSTPSASGSTSVDDFMYFSVSESSSMSTSVSGRLDMVDQENDVIKISGTGKENVPAGRKKQISLHPGRRLKHASYPSAQTKTTDGPSFRLLKSDAQPGMIEPDMYAYTQPSSRPTSHERRPSTPSARRICLPHIVPPRRSPVAARSSGEIKTLHRPSKLSVVNVPGSDISLYQGNYFSTPAAETFSVSQGQWYNDRFSMGVQSTLIEPETPIAEPALYSKYLVPSAGNRLSKPNPLATMASNFPDFVELAFMDRLSENFRPNPPDVLCPLQENGLTWIGPPPPKRHYDRRPGVEPDTDTTAGYHFSAVNPDYLEALDPLRAPLKHLTGLLTKYRDEDGTYLSLLYGLQDPAGRRKIIGCLSNEELTLHDPFSAAMGLALLSRLDVL